MRRFLPAAVIAVLVLCWAMTAVVTAAARPALHLDKCSVYPNPSDISVVFRYYVRGASSVTVDVYDSSGDRIIRLEGAAVDGFNSVYWDLTDEKDDRVSAGTYYYRVKAHSSGNTIEKRSTLRINR